ncbi:unnamed protein product [Musa acuminata subsp. burmannicoides]
MSPFFHFLDKEAMVVTASSPSPGWKAAALGLTKASGDPFGRRIQLILMETGTTSSKLGNGDLEVLERFIS